MILPKPHISWSQLNLWNTNKERFRREYFENAEKLDTKYLRFGKGFATLIEAVAKNPELLKDKVWAMNNLGMDTESSEYINFIQDLKWYDTPEHEIKCTIMGVPVLSFIDSYDSKNNVFYEYKTGKHPWDQAKVQKHDQLTFYAMVLKHSTGRIPKSCDLIWIQTRDGATESVDFWRESTNGAINITGLVKEFHREFDDREIERLEDMLIRSAEEISEAYQNFIKEI